MGGRREACMQNEVLKVSRERLVGQRSDLAGVRIQSAKIRTRH